MTASNHDATPAKSENPLFAIGEGYKTRDGRAARIICNDAQFDGRPILALVKENGREYGFNYYPDGRFSPYAKDDSPHDLTPTPGAGASAASESPAKSPAPESANERSA